MLLAQITSSEKNTRTRRWVGYSFVLSAFALLASAQIVLPLRSDIVSGLTVITVLALLLCTLSIATLSWEYKEIARAFLGVTTLALAIEVVGTRTDWPFGAYSYSPRLQPQILGVPCIVPVAWFAMALPAWEVGRRLFPSRPHVQWLTGGFLLSAWDLFLDPQMVGNHFWTWNATSSASAGLAMPSWQGIPLTNYLGWLIVGTAAVGMISFALGAGRPNPLLVGLYLWMSGFSALGFILPFAFDQPIVGVVGALVALPLPIFALRTYPRTWPTSQ